MGTWSEGSFGNDTACDWAFSLEESSDLSLVRDTIQQVLNGGDESIEAGQAEEAVAAIEVIARLQGNFGERDAYSEQVDNWVEAHAQEPPAELVAAAIKALDRIVTPPSELLELWQESDGVDSWKSAIAELRNRLKK